MIRFLSIAPLLLAATACVSVLPEAETPEGLYRFGAMPVHESVDATVIVREPDASRLVGGRAPLRRFAPCVLRWKTLRVSSAPHPCGFEFLRLPTRKRPGPLWA